MNWLSALSTIVTFVFVGAVFNRYRLKKGNHLLFWGIGLVFYGLGTLTEVILSVSYSTPALKIWYLSGAILTAAWLGQGTVFLLLRKKNWAKVLAAGLITLSLVALLLVAMAPVTDAAASYSVSQPASAQYKEILVRNGFIIFLTIFLNLYGTIALVGGAIYSAYLFWRKSILLNRVIGNILIAAGAMLPALGGTWVLAGLVDWLYLSEFVGVILMYVGFIQATATAKAPASQQAVAD